MPWPDYDTETLLWTRGNLLVGLARIRDHIAAGTIDDVSPKGGGSARSGGQVTMALLEGVEAELTERGELPDGDFAPDQGPTRGRENDPGESLGRGEPALPSPR